MADTPSEAHVRESLALTLFEIGAVRLGQFKLHSGQTSPIYIDLRLLASFPDALRLATAAYRSVLEPLSFDLLAAIPHAGLPLGTALCLDMNVPMIFPRKMAKGYGTGKAVEGRWEAGQIAVVIDDVISSGASKLESIAPLTAAGLQVTDVVVLIDREQSGRQILEEAGYRLHSVLTLGELLAILEREGRISADELARIVAEVSGLGPA